MSRAAGLAAVAVLCLVLMSGQAVTAGSYRDLQPDVSTREDVERVLGAPLREIVEGQRYDYAGDNEDTRRISIRFRRETGLIEAIDVYPSSAYSVAQYREWFRLQTPDREEYDADGNLIQLYDPQGMALHFEGSDQSSGVRFFRHRARVVEPQVTGSRPDGAAPRRGLADYVAASDRAEEAKDWDEVLRLADEGLASFPDSADLWSSRGHACFYGADLPPDRRRHELLRAVTTAYDLEPTSSRALDLGWVHYQIFHGCTLALYYFEKAGSETGTRRPELYFYMADCYEQVGDLQQAAAFFARFLDAAPEHENAEEARYRLGGLMEGP